LTFEVQINLISPYYRPVIFDHTQVYGYLIIFGLGKHPETFRPLSAIDILKISSAALMVNVVISYYVHRRYL